MEKGSLMGCCNPNYRKTVNEQEENVNLKGSDSLSLFIKIIIIAIVIAGGLITVILV
ncbi:hypothetical protein ACFYKT_21800 [Cytobacillus sp. FJAT-53684]|uniref:Uncharacterized protein n=1 Tax=Cytobacillus mangrovibacter TaxID=3299024 RepID=A0ABW6K442_9BACI